MVIDQATEMAFDRYREMLSNKGYTAKNHVNNGVFYNLLPREQLEHALWMCEECLKYDNKHWSIDKSSRWLGFVQCVLIMRGLTTINAERNITRSWFS